MKKTLILSAFLAVSSVLIYTYSETRNQPVGGENPLHHLKGDAELHKELGTRQKSQTPKMKPVKAPAKKYKMRWAASQKKAKSRPSQMDNYIEEQNQKLMSDEEFSSARKPTQKKKASITVANKERSKTTPWVRKYSGGEANVSLAKTTKEKKECTQENCPERKKSINLVGVVVETDRIKSKTENLVAGEIEMGDARKLPAVYVK